MPAIPKASASAGRRAREQAGATLTRGPRTKARNPFEVETTGLELHQDQIIASA